MTASCSNPAFRGRFPAFRNLFDAIAARGSIGIAAQGITVAGVTAEEVRILNNTVAGVLQGIHVGVSTHAARGVHSRAEVVTVSGNTVACTLPAEAGTLERRRHLRRQL